MTESLWTRRVLNRDDADEVSDLKKLFGYQYGRSKAASRAIRRSRTGGGPLADDERARLDAFTASMVPLWDWLIANCEVDLVVDACDATIMLGWAVQSGPEVLHSVGVKRSMVEAGFAQERASARSNVSLRTRRGR